MTHRAWRMAGGSLELDRPRIMAILNLTPDSFSDGGRFDDPAAAVARARALVAEGADILDIGGESTRPGADPVSAAEEIRRVTPVLREAASLGVPLSIDTTKAEVAREALAAGAVIVNDVSALADSEMTPLIAGSGAGVVLMHMRGEPRTMQLDPRYGNVVEEVRDHLAARRRLAMAAGIAAEQIVIDPGIGFGKTTEHNLRLLSGIERLATVAPVLIGASRKRFLGELTGEPDPARRVNASVAAVLAARARGASLFRVHDVAATREALAVWETINNSDTTDG